MSTTTVTAKYLDPSGNPCKGRVVFRLVAATYQDGLDAIFPTVPVSDTLNASGEISVELEPTSGVDAAFDATDMTYQVWERINGTDRAPYYVDIPTAAAVDLGTLATYDDPPLFVRELVTPDLDALGYVGQQSWTPGTPEDYARWADSTDVHPEAGIEVYTGTFAATIDPALAIGWNFAHGTQRDTNWHYAAQVFEFDYNDGSRRNTEMYWEWKKTGVGTVRPYFTQINNATGEARNAVDLGPGTLGYFNIEESFAAVTHYKFDRSNALMYHPLYLLGTAPELGIGDYAQSNDSLITFKYKSGYLAGIRFELASALTPKWQLYVIGGDSNFYMRDLANGLMHFTCTPGAGTTGVTAFTGGVTVGGTLTVAGNAVNTGAWSSWTPALGGTGAALGNGTATGKYTQIGKTVHFYGKIVFGSTTTVATSGATTFSFPVNAKLTDVAHLKARAYDNGSAYYELATQPGTTVTQLYVYGTAGIYASGVATTSPFTWTTGDELWITGTFEAA